MNYNEFLEKKKIKILDTGFNISESELNSNLFDFQKYIVAKALKKGRYAIFADCGLGKTLMQLEFAYQSAKHTSKKSLILCPLAVKGQTIKEADKFGVDLSMIDIYNYEQIENIDCSIYNAVILDESSILKNFNGATKMLIIERFARTQFKLCCTATPSPNDLMEIANHSEFLNIMDRNKLLATYFVHDGGDTSKWRLKGHSEELFYDWISTWAISITTPSDIGFDGSGYALPKLNYIEKQITTETKESLFATGTVNALSFNKELRLTKIDRLEEVATIVNNSKENFIIWINQNEEGEYLKTVIPDSIEVKGSDKPEYKEKMLLGFANNEFRVLITKTKIASFGLNYQNCNNQIFASLDFSFEKLYQAIRRSYRFGQKKEVNIYLVTTDSMENVVKSLERKEKQFRKMQNKLKRIQNEKI